MSRQNSLVVAMLLLTGGLLLESVLAQSPVQQAAPVQQVAPVPRRAPQATPSEAIQQAPLTSVPTESLGRTHQLVGPLGLPLGEMVTVTLQVETTPQKSHFDNFVTVTAIGGRGLRQPIRMPAKLWQWSDIKSLKDGERWIARVYQDGGMISVPGQAMKETVPVSTAAAYGFATWLVIVKSAR